MLQGNGYTTGGFGKWHLTPDAVQGVAGPFDRWPNSWGFDHFWGFIGAEAGQYDPVVIQDNTILGVPEGKDGEEYYLPDDLTDQAVHWLHGVRAQSPVKPWFMYYATGCSHAPHHVAADWSAKYKGKFDQGWDKLREETFARQKKLGVVPEDALLTPRPGAFPAWDSLSADEKQLYARQLEVYAGYSENADTNVGRLLDAVEEMGETDNTLLIFIWGDNGASLEGTVTGTFNEVASVNGIPLTPEQQLSLVGQYGGLDAWGTDAFAPHYSAAWAWAGNCPFQWGKQVGSHLGGQRDGMVVSWPERIKDVGGMRSQFTHCIDIGPTILEAVGIPEAKVVDGVPQRPMRAPASSTHSTTPAPPSATRSSTSRSWAAAPSTRTAGGRAPSPTATPGTSPRRPSPGSRPAPTTPSRTPGSSTTCRTTSARQTTSRARIRRSWPSCASSSGKRPRSTT
jgi:arylsulfatase A-like enzyme